MVSDLLPWRFGVYSLFDCVKGTYLDVRLAPAYDGGSDVSDEMLYMHAEDSDWPYQLSHNPPAWSQTLRDHHEHVWGPGGITETPAPPGMHASLSHGLLEWHAFFQLLDEEHYHRNGVIASLKMLYEHFHEDLEDDLSKIMANGNIVPKPANPQWRRNAISLWGRIELTPEMA